MALTLLQTTGNTNGKDTSVFAMWPAPTQAGSVLFAVIGIAADSGNAADKVTDVSVNEDLSPDWKDNLVDKKLSADKKSWTLMYQIRNAATRSGLEAFFLQNAAKKPQAVAASLILVEYAGGGTSNRDKTDESEGDKNKGPASGKVTPTADGAVLSALGAAAASVKFLESNDSHFALVTQTHSAAVSCGLVLCHVPNAKQKDGEHKHGFKDVKPTPDSWSGVIVSFT